MRSAGRGVALGSLGGHLCDNRLGLRDGFAAEAADLLFREDAVESRSGAAARGLDGSARPAAPPLTGGE